MCRPASVSSHKTCGGKAEEPTAGDESGAVMRSQCESLHAVRRRNARYRVNCHSPIQYDRKGARAFYPPAHGTRGVSPHR
eukprot:1337363-Prymnesium_polylepis.1